MKDVAAEGRTVLFVSHNMAAVASLCERGVLLDGGETTFDGPAQETIEHYLQTIVSTGQTPLHRRADRRGDGSVKMISLRINGPSHDQIIRSSSPLEIKITYRSEKPLSNPRFLLGIYDYTNMRIFLLDSDAASSLPQQLPQEGTVTCTTGNINLTPGRCYINIALFRAGVMADYIGHASSFDVVADNQLKLRKIPFRNEALCVVQHKWDLLTRK